MRAIGRGDTVVDGAGGSAPGARLWVLPPATDQSELEQCSAVLSGEERERASRFVFDADRRLYLTAHIAVRYALSTVHSSVDPRAWVFGSEPGGRPFAQGSRPWDFNLSHTHGAVACLVAPGARCGVDVETVSDRAAELGDSVFAPSELEYLSASGSHAAVSATSLWTLKEAYAKARGLGLRLPFARCEFTMHGAAIALAARPDGDADRYRFHCLRIGDHIVSVALNASHGTTGLTVRSGRPDWRRPGEWFGRRPESPVTTQAHGGAGGAPDSTASPQSSANS